jgi:hypothetical protein
MRGVLEDYHGIPNYRFSKSMIDAEQWSTGNDRAMLKSQKHAKPDFARSAIGSLPLLNTSPGASIPNIKDSSELPDPTPFAH